MATHRHSSDRILTELKRGGPQTASQLGALLGISAEGARQHLLRLANAGLVTSNSQIGGVGRPSQVWQLTECSRGHFPDTHADLTVQLIEGVRQIFGDEGLRQLVDNREQKMLQNYRAALAGATGLRERVARLAQVRTQEGYMARWEDLGGALLLIEDHCPIQCAAQHCRPLCDSELALFENLLGPGVRIERDEHIVAGARRCRYRISGDRP